MSLTGLQARLRRVTGSGAYIAQIDGLRFFAIVPVVMFHLGSRAWRAWAPSGDPTPFDDALVAISHRLFPAKAGVELFFVISGFIIAHPFVHAALGSGRAPRLAEFYQRRVTRLEPPYMLAVGAAFAFVVLSGTSPSAELPGGYTLWESLAASLVYLHGPVLGELPEVLPVAWSLEVEFAFYLVAPAIFAAYFRIREPVVRFTVGITSVLGLVLALNPLHAWVGESMRFLLPRFLHLFLTGVVLADLFAWKPPRGAGRAGLDVLFLSGMAVAIGTEAVMPDYRQPAAPALEALRAAGYAGMFVAAFYGRWSPRLLSSSWIPTIGGMCYTIYLTHLPVQQVLAGLVVRAVRPEGFAFAWLAVCLGTMPVVAGVAVTYFLLVEKPCMRRDWPRRLWERLGGGSGTASGAVPREPH